jgi:urease gamma subunit
MSDNLSEYQRIISHSIRGLVDNEEEVLAAVTEAVIDRIRYGSGYPEVNAETYQIMWRERPDEIADNLRDAIQDAILDKCEATGFADELLRDLMDLGSRAIWADIADTYVPTPEDYADAIGEEL